MEEFSHNQEALAKTVGKSRSHVANMIRLLGLPEPVKKMLDSNDLSAGHARALLNAPNPLEIARQVVKKGFNVRQTERLVKKEQRKKDAPPKSEYKDVDTQALERNLANLLGLKVGIKFKAGGGSLTVHYDSLEQLDDILKRLGQGGMAAAAPEEVQKKTAAKKSLRKPRDKKPKLSIGLKAKRRGKKKAAG
jgi:ParB family chromosome partitioning protein